MKSICKLMAAMACVVAIVIVSAGCSPNAGNDSSSERRREEYKVQFECSIQRNNGETVPLANLPVNIFRDDPKRILEQCMPKAKFDEDRSVTERVLIALLLGRPVRNEFGVDEAKFKKLLLESHVATIETGLDGRSSVSTIRPRISLVYAVVAKQINSQYAYWVECKSLDEGVTNSIKLSSNNLTFLESGLYVD